MTQLVLPSDDIEAPNNYLQYLSGRWHHARKLKQDDNKSSAHVAYPEPRNRLSRELKSSHFLGKTPDGKHIYLFNYRINSSVIRELGRLREMTFRAVGEGTHKVRDNDDFDKHYRHIILWSEEHSEIVGSYRIGEAFRISSANNICKLYTSRLFSYQNHFTNLFPRSIELGRSFIQPKYWGKRGLDYLWWGIGAYLIAHPNIRYLFGAVSISNELPSLAKQQIVGCYQHFYQPDNYRQYATARTPFHIDRSIQESFRGFTFKQSSKRLRASLQQQEVSLPVLYKHYSELCRPEGTKFIDFNIDPEFSYCIDGLMLVDLAFMKDQKRRRYLAAAN